METVKSGLCLPFQHSFLYDVSNLVEQPPDITGGNATINHSVMERMKGNMKLFFMSLFPVVCCAASSESNFFFLLLHNFHFLHLI